MDADGRGIRIATGIFRVEEDAAAGGEEAIPGLPTAGGEFTIGAALAAGALPLGAALVIASRRRAREDADTESPTT